MEERGKNMAINSLEASGVSRCDTRARFTCLSLGWLGGAALDTAGWNMVMMLEVQLLKGTGGGALDAAGVPRGREPPPPSGAAPRATA